MFYSKQKPVVVCRGRRGSLVIGDRLKLSKASLASLVTLPFPPKNVSNLLGPSSLDRGE